MEKEPLEEEAMEEEHPMLSLRKGKASRLESDLFYWLQSLVGSIIAIVFVFTFVMQITIVSGHSMDPTLADGEMLLVWRLGYSPERNDIVIVNKTTAKSLGGQSIVKRVIATSGQQVQINYNTNQVFVDGVALEEDYTLEPMRDIYHSDNIDVIVPEGSIFVLGDNRNASSDSRASDIGMIDEGYVLGKAILGVWPSSSWRVF